MVTKASEFIAFIALVGIGVRTPALRKWAEVPRVAAAALGIALVVGGGFWGVGHVGDVVFPYLGHDDAHQSEHIPGIEVTDAGMQVGGSMGLMGEHASLSLYVEVGSEVDHHAEGEVDLVDIDHHATN